MFYYQAGGYQELNQQIFLIFTSASFKTREGTSLGARSRALLSLCRCQTCPSPGANCWGVLRSSHPLPTKAATSRSPLLPPQRSVEPSGFTTPVTPPLAKSAGNCPRCFFGKTNLPGDTKFANTHTKTTQLSYLDRADALSEWPWHILPKPRASPASS